MKKLIVLVFATLFSLSAIAALPTIPSDCFDREFYCSSSTIKTINGKKAIEVKFFATLVADNYKNHEEIIELFTDFPAWVDYTDGAEEIDVVSSRTVSSRVLAGKRVMAQYARYYMNAPWPVNRMEIIEQSTYNELDKIPGTVAVWSFKTDRDFNLKGVKRKDGTLYLSYDEDNKEYVVRVIMEVEPDTSFLKIASKYIKAGITRLFLGMFDL